MAKVAFIGLGVMGFPMAGHLKVKGGHDVTVYNRTAAKAQAWVENSAAPSPRRRQKPPAMPTSCSPVWAMTTISGR